MKLRHTKKQEFQDTVNLDSKSQLAKLLATENITIEHNNVSTASFDVKNRVLTLPIFKVKNKNVYDMLITHEAGHALHTVCDDWSEIGNDEKLRMAVNVLEDTRIDKLMQTQYPGVIEDYKKGFDTLNNSNFYGLQDNNINDLSVLDKINIRSKSLNRVDIDFTDEELEWVKKTDDIKTFDDVMKLAKQIVAYNEQKEQEQMLEENDIKSENEKSDDESQDEPNNSSDSEEDNDNQDEGDNQNSKDGEEDNKKDENEQRDDETYREFKDRLEKQEKEKELQKTSMAPQNMQDDDFGITNREFEKAVQDKLAQTDKESARVYGNLPKPNLKNIIVDYKQFIKDFGNEIDKKSKSRYKEEMLPRYKSFKNDSMKTVNYLVKEFEMKKSATAYRRATTSKTGIIDPMMLSKYKFTDDIFKKLSIIPDAKNHGMIILVDWSGSMSNIINSVIQQLMNLAWFCRKINIPFEVYAFSNYYGYSYSRSSDDKVKGKSWDKKLKDVNFQNFNLINFLSHRMNNKDFEKGMLNMYLTLEAYDYRSWSKNSIVEWNTNDYSYPITLASCMSLGSTPLNAALASMIDIVPMFKQKYGIEKMSFITLTDGASDGGEGLVSEYKDEETGLMRLTNDTIRGKMIINVKGKNYTTDVKSSYYGSEKMTALLLSIIRDRNNTNNVGFYLIESKSRKHLNWAIDSYDDKGNYVGANIENAMKDLTKHNCHLTTKSGYDKYFITVGSTKVQSADLSSLDRDAKTSDIKKLFKNSMKGRLKSRVLLNNFIEEVA